MIYKKLLCILVVSACFPGCDYSGNVLMTGTISGWSRSDTMFVTLTRKWESIRRAPKRFTIQPSGDFELEFTAGRNPPPVTFVKNNAVYAVLTINNLRGPSPLVIDETRNIVFEIKYDNGLFLVKLKL